MSRFSGKCDLYDVLDIHSYTDEELKNNVKIYIGNSNEPLHIERKEDLIPFYPYIVASAGFDNANRSCSIKLSSESFVDTEEKQILDRWFKALLRMYNHCKSKHVDFDVNEAVRRIRWFFLDRNALFELANRVKESGQKANFEGIHLEIKEFYRKKLVDEMLSNNINPADYGYERLV